MGDMRGRVVAARLVKDGKLPYYYNWYPGDSLRYYVGTYIDSPRVAPDVVSQLTVSPAILHVMEPIAGYDEYFIDWGAFILFHLLFIISIILVWYRLPVKKRAWSLLLLMPVILTDGWLYHFYMVQYYMLFGFMLLVISLLILGKKEIIAGLLLAALFLFKFTAIVYLLPFLLTGLKYRRLFLSFGAGIAAYAVFALFNPFERNLWQEYFSTLKEHQAIHMEEAGTVDTPMARIYTLPLLPSNFEGQNYLELDSLRQASGMHINQEASNLKQAYKAVLHKYPPKWLLHILFIVSAGVVCIGLVWRRRKEGAGAIPVYKLIIAAILLYFLTNFFSTITVAVYQFPQWWAMAAIMAIYIERIPRIAIALFLAGIIISWYIFPDFQGKHILSEILLLTASAIAAIFSRPLREDNALSHPIEANKVSLRNG